MPSARAASAALPGSREAIATSSTPRAARIAGIIFRSANRETPKTPNRNIRLDDSPVRDDAVLGDDHDPFADVVALAVLFFDAGLVDDPDTAPDARVLVDDGVFDDRFRADADHRNAARFGGAHVLERLVEIRADQQAVADVRGGADAAADPDHGAVDLGAVHDAALGDERVMDVAPLDLGRGEKSGVRVDGVLLVVEIKGRDRLAQRQIGLEIGLDGSDVLPVAAVDVRLNALARHGVGDDVPPEVDQLGARERQLEHVALEDVDAHRREVSRSAAIRQLGDQRGQALGGGLLVEVDDAPGGVHLEDAEAAGLIRRDRDDRHRRVGAAFVVGPQHVLVVHAVELIAREDQQIAPGGAAHVAQTLADGVGGSLTPVAATPGLLGRPPAPPARRADVELVGHGDVLVEALRVELREHEDLTEVRVQAIADRDVDQAVLAADRNGGLRAFERQREQARPAPPPPDDRPHVVHGRANLSP